MTLTRSRVRKIQQSNYRRYSQALEVEHVIPALHRIMELQPKQSGNKLIDTDYRIEYTALLSLVHSIVERSNMTATIRALYIWLELRDMALTSVTFNVNGYNERPPQSHLETFKRLVRVSVEREARRRDALLVAMAMKMADAGTLEEKVVHSPRSEAFTNYLESLKPPDIESIVNNTLKEIHYALPNTQIEDTATDSRVIAGSAIS